MNKECTEYQKNIPAYVLQALERNEALALELHLEECAACQEELNAYRQVSQYLLLAVPPQVPPSSLRARLEQRLKVRKRQERGYGWKRVASRSLVWGALLLLVGLNLFSLLQIHALQRHQAQLLERLQEVQTAFVLLAYPDTESLPIAANLEQVTGRLLLDKKHNVAVLLIWNLPPPNSDHVYQAWLIDEHGDRTSAALFVPDPSLPFTTVTLISPPSFTFADFNGLGVTLEPEGGSPFPTGPRLLEVDF